MGTVIARDKTTTTTDKLWRNNNNNDYQRWSPRGRLCPRGFISSRTHFEVIGFEAQVFKSL